MRPASLLALAERVSLRACREVQDDFTLQKLVTRPMAISDLAAACQAVDQQTQANDALKIIGGIGYHLAHNDALNHADIPWLCDSLERLIDIADPVQPSGTMTPDAPMDGLTVTEAAEEAGVELADISGACRGPLKSTGKGTARRIDPESLRQWMKTRELKAAAGSPKPAMPDITSAECDQCGAIVTLKNGAGKCPKCNSASGFTPLKPSAQRCATPRKR